VQSEALRSSHSTSAAARFEIQPHLVTCWRTRRRGRARSDEAAALAAKAARGKIAVRSAPTRWISPSAGRTIAAVAQLGPIERLRKNALGASCKRTVMQPLSVVILAARSGQAENSDLPKVLPAIGRAPHAAARDRRRTRSPPDQHLRGLCMAAC